MPIMDHVQSSDLVKFQGEFDELVHAKILDRIGQRSEEIASSVMIDGEEVEDASAEETGGEDDGGEIDGE